MNLFKSPTCGNKHDPGLNCAEEGSCVPVHVAPNMLTLAVYTAQCIHLYIQPYKISLSVLVYDH